MTGLVKGKVRSEAPRECLCDTCQHSYIKDAFGQRIAQYCANVNSIWYLKTTGCNCKLYEQRTEQIKGE